MEYYLADGRIGYLSACIQFHGNFYLHEVFILYILHACTRPWICHSLLGAWLLVVNIELTIIHVLELDSREDIGLVRCH